MFNDFYAKDTSKKVRAIKRAQGQAGEHLTKPPYSYIVSPTDKKQWIVDEEAAAVVKRVFDLCIGGKVPMQIAKILKEDKVPTAKAYYAKKKGQAFPDNPYDWRASTIVGILERMDYCGHTVNFKSYSKSHKLKKRIPTTKEQQAIFFNTHEAIVEDAVFERVQELRSNKRRPTEFIKKIIVHAPEKVDGKRVQKVDIVFNFVGELNFLSATQPKRQGA